MDALKLIPQLFFDLIARVIPGATAFMLWVWLWPGCGWACVLDSAAGGKLDTGNVFAFAFFVPLGVGFVVGHVIAPIGKWLRKVTGRKPAAEPWRQYDWLRMHRPDAGALAAKIRAEYTMHFSLAAAFLLGCALALYGAWQPAAPVLAWWKPLAMLALFTLSLYRGHEAVGTFCTSVKYLHAAAQERVRPPDPAWSDEEPVPRSL